MHSARTTSRAIKHWHRPISTRRAALALLMTALSIAAVSIPTSTSVSAETRQDIVAVIGLALQSSRHRLRHARQRCDAHAARVSPGNVIAALGLAHCFKSGVGRSKSLLRAKALYEQAARQDSAEAHLALGQFYQDGRIVRRDTDRAAHHVRRAARAGLAAAMTEYGLMIMRNNSHQHALACSWFARAARAGAGNGIRLLGDCFASGLGGRSNRVLATDLYVRAASLGDRTAALKLAGEPFIGVGGEIAAREGCDWAAEAARRTNQAASKAVAFCLRERN